MKKEVFGVRFWVLVNIFALIMPQFVFAFSFNSIAADDQLLDVYSTGKQELNAILSKGSLAEKSFKDVNGKTKTATDIIWDTAQQFYLNPKFLTVVLQKEQSLIEDPDPTQDQLDWAMGYAICDSCSKTEPALQKYKGFGNQVYYAAKRIRESYLSDLEGRGYTESGIGPGIETEIDGVPVTPKNLATAVLYTYTPHLKGNLNFSKIWERWFNFKFVDGSLLKDKSNNEVWLIQDERRRKITSMSVLLSRFNPDQIIYVGTSVLLSYDEGQPIQFPNYSLLRSPKGNVYLIVDDEKRGFVSKEVFRALGFSPDEIMDVGWEDLSTYKDGKPIDATTVYPKGTLLQDKKTGGVFYVQNGVKQPIMSKEIMLAHFPSPKITQVESTALEIYETAGPLSFPSGTLIGVKGSPDVFVISKGSRYPISNEATFLSYGWNWNQIIWTNERSVLIHKLSDPIDITKDQSNIYLATE